MNRTILMGNIGQDPELRMTSGGQACLKFSLATSESWKDKDGKKQERTEWHRCIMWGKRAEALAPHLSKGSKIAVEGRIQYGSYEKEGVKHYTTDIVLDNLHFAGGKRDAGAGPSDYGGGYGKQKEEKPAAEESLDDIPF